MRLNLDSGEIVFLQTEEDVHKSKIIEGMKQAQKMGDRIAIDTETTGLDRFDAHVVIWSAYFNPVGTSDVRYVLTANLLHLFRDLFEDVNFKWILTNAKFDMSMLANHKITITGKVYDTLIMDWLMDPDKSNIHDLKACAHRHLDLHLRSYKDVFGDRKILDVLMDPETREEALDYASMDAWATYKLGVFYEKILTKRDSWKFIERLYVPLIPILWKMERRGILINLQALEQIRDMLEQNNSNIKQKVAKKAGRIVNLNPSKDLFTFIFEDLKLQPIKYTSGGTGGVGKPSMDSACMKAWAEQEPIMAEILEYRQNTKLMSTYVNGLLKKLRNNRIHTTLNAHITATGRLSSSNPNLQNIPTRTKIGRKIREAFIAGPGNVLIVADYSQLEMMIAAHISGDPDMISLIKEGKDLHSGTAAMMFGVSYDDIITAKDPDSDMDEDLRNEFLSMRKDSKNIGFGVLYGMGANHLASDLGCTKKEAEEKIRMFFDQFKRVEKYVKKQHEYAISKKEVNTIIGRPRYIHAAIAKGSDKFRALRLAVNTPVQGSAADIVMLAMITLGKNKRLAELQCEMLLQVHDELIFECPIENAREAGEIIRHHMEHPGIELKVPLNAEPEFGYNWVEAKG